MLLLLLLHEVTVAASAAVDTATCTSPYTTDCLLDSYHAHSQMGHACT